MVDHQRCVQIARQALESRGQVCSVPDRAPDHAIHRLDVAHERFARGDADPDREFRIPEPAQLRVERGCRFWE
jgi:hypothetical protein